MVYINELNATSAQALAPLVPLGVVKGRDIDIWTAGNNAIGNIILSPRKDIKELSFAGRDSSVTDRILQSYDFSNKEYGRTAATATQLPEIKRQNIGYDIEDQFENRVSLMSLESKGKDDSSSNLSTEGKSGLTSVASNGVKSTDKIDKNSEKIFAPGSPKRLAVKTRMDSVSDDNDELCSENSELLVAAKKLYLEEKGKVSRKNTMKMNEVNKNNDIAGKSKQVNNTSSAAEDKTTSNDTKPPKRMANFTFHFRNQITVPIDRKKLENFFRSAVYNEFQPFFTESTADRSTASDRNDESEDENRKDSHHKHTRDITDLDISHHSREKGRESRIPLAHSGLFDLPGFLSKESSVASSRRNSLNLKSPNGLGLG